ncbi:MAG: ribonuclease T2 family protein [Rhizobiaceae bacterium]
MNLRDMGIMFRNPLLLIALAIAVLTALILPYILEGLEQGLILAPDQERYVLAFSWQPAFCEMRPKKPECTSQTNDRYDADHFSLHGLWPQPRSKAYCDVAPDLVSLDKDGRWTELPRLELTEETYKTLANVMPGTMSGLDRHEWYKHGSCYTGKTAEQYYADSLALMEQINNSPVRDLFAENIGNELETVDIQAVFNSTFGQGSGDRIRVACKQDGSRRIITEITLGLVGNLEPPPDMENLILASQPVDSGCPGGIVDAVGLQ